MAPVKRIPVEISLPSASSKLDAHKVISKNSAQDSVEKLDLHVSYKGKRKAGANLEPRRETKRVKNGSPTELHLKPPNSDCSFPDQGRIAFNTAVNNDDAVSSQRRPDDFQAELLSAKNMEDTDLKAAFAMCINKHLDNTKLHVIREELRKVFNDGKYCGITTCLPQTTFLLDLIRKELD